MDEAGNGAGCYSAEEALAGYLTALAVPDDEDSEVCRCGSCGVTFADAIAFDRHRLRGRCADPAERGLVPLWCGWKWLR